MNKLQEIFNPTKEQRQKQINQINKVIQSCLDKVEEEYWFKYDIEKDGFFRIEKPEAAYGVCNHALG